MPTMIESGADPSVFPSLSTAKPTKLAQHNFEIAVALPV